MSKFWILAHKTQNNLTKMSKFAFFAHFDSILRPVGMSVVISNELLILTASYYLCGKDAFATKYEVRREIL